MFYRTCIQIGDEEEKETAGRLRHSRGELASGARRLGKLLELLKVLVMLGGSQRVARSRGREEGRRAQRSAVRRRRAQPPSRGSPSGGSRMPRKLLQVQAVVSTRF